jgi:hypothetical protein
MGNLVKTEPIYIFACPSPFTQERKTLELWDRYVSIREIITDLQPNEAYRKNAYVAVNGERIPEEDWNYFYPAPGSTVAIRVIPKASAIIGIATAIGAAAASAGAGAAATAAGWLAVNVALISAVAAMAVSVVGFIVQTALIRPPGKGGSSTSPTQRLSQEEQDTPTSYLTGAQNRAAPYGVVPRVYGTLRITPPLAAQSYTELVNRVTVPFRWTGDVSVSKQYAGQPGYYNLTEWLGEDQYLRMAICWGYGPVSIKGIRIGETALGQFSPYSIEHRYGYPEDEPLTLYSNDVYEETIDAALTNAGGWVVRTTQRNCDEISIDIGFNGLFQTDPETGARRSLTVGFLIRYKAVGPSGGWIYLPVFNCSGARMSAVRRGYRWRTNGGQYDVAVLRMTSDFDGQYTTSEAYWVSLRSVSYTQPVKDKGIAVSALYIKATDHLNGVIDELNGVVTSILWDWDKISKQWVLRETNNPASIIRDILIGNTAYNISANPRPISSSRVDMTSLQTFHDWCAANGFTCNVVFDTATTVWDVLQLVAACGRGTMAIVNGAWGVVIDKDQTTAVQHFTPRNSWDFKASQAFLEELHGFRIKFLNEDEDYLEAETTVYMDGYDESNATKFEDLSLPGVTNYDHAYKLARYFLAVSEYRRETITFTTDFEHLVCQRGDRIRFSHDVMLLGLQSGRLADYSADGAHYTHVVLDEDVELAYGNSYNIRFRLADGTSLLKDVYTDVGITNTLRLQVPVVIGGVFPEIGDLYTFGEAGTETEDLIVKSIDPGSDLTATLECTLYAPTVFTADQGPIPPYVPKITVPLEWQTPTVDTVYSDGSVLIWAQGQWQSRVLVTFTFPTFLPTYTGIEGWFRKSAETDGGAWVSVETSLVERELSLIPVEDGATYEMKFRYIRHDGTRGIWSSLYTHTVLGKTAKPSDVTGFAGSFFGGIVNFKWDKVTDVDVTAYEIRYGEVGTVWNDGTVVVQTLSSTVAITTLLPVGSWEALIKAIDIVGNYSANATSCFITISSTYQTVYQQTHIGWPGSKTNYVENLVTGHLNTESTILATGNNFTLFNSYVASACATAMYAGATISLGGEDTVRCYANVYGVLGAGETTGVISPTIQMNTGTGWTDWTIGTITATAVRFRFVSPASRGLFAVSRFECNIDKEAVIESGELNITGTGVATATFSAKFYTKPLLQVSAQATGGMPRIASYSNVTTSYFLGHIHTTNGTPTEGVLTYLASSRGDL